MMVSDVCGSCTCIQRTGFHLASDDTYSLWEGGRAMMHLCSSLPLPFPPSWLALVSIEVGNSTERGGDCRSLCVAMDAGTPCLRLTFCLAPCPSSSIGDEFNLNLTLTNVYNNVLFISILIVLG